MLGEEKACVLIHWEEATVIQKIQAISKAIQKMYRYLRGIYIFVYQVHFKY